MYRIAGGKQVSIDWGDTIVYRRATVAPAYRGQAEDQGQEGGPYRAVCVSLEDGYVQVRAAGWGRTESPLYNVQERDITEVVARQK
jgi:hypothetical protein